jgi:hypothetical protein
MGERYGGGERNSYHGGGGGGNQRLGMIHFLPDNLLALFAPRPPVQFKPPPDEIFVHRRLPRTTGVSMFVDKFEVVFTFNDLSKRS